MKFGVKFSKIRANVKNKARKYTPGAYEYILARTAFFDKIFMTALKNNIPQIVILGAGYDTRAYRFAELNNVTSIIELDIAPTQNRKKKCLRKAHIDISKQAVLISVDFNTEPIKEALARADYNCDEKALFIWEGVSMYLNPESVDATLEFVKNSSGNESAIAFDYAISISEENIDNFYGAREFVQTWKKHRSDEPFKFSIDENKIQSFIEQRGLKTVVHLTTMDIERTFLTNDDGSLIGRSNGLFRFAMASTNT